ncbi:protein translocase subunit SecDF [Priestia taiwanensis]|uniref:Multifunctional fusion protein n=1 Tax=Priestia taiwanensis TaxID=1347902 RepID=A0A917AWB4_9BACI|nr:protein translocase subunit SecDF [Priestia taiwanensis]MBM7363644.1 SecD/SecF fusion protein [Priestia taiwanensis]GGE75343.1 protein translocase subunit SecDF [Priestia taiwanensis]
MVKRSRIVAFFLLVILLVTTIGTTTTKTTDNIKLGLDLQGGFEILYEVHPAKDGDIINEEALKSTVKALDKRINVLGVSEPNIQIEGDNRIRVQLAGVTDQNKAREILSTQAKLSFRDADDVLLMDGSDLKEGGASQQFDEHRPIVSLKLKDAAKFADVTGKVLAKAPANQMAIWLDFEEGVDSFKSTTPKYISAPHVNEVLDTTDVQISGNFTVEEAKELASLLNAGALPVELEEIYSTSVGASFGEAALEKTIFASYIGIGLILLFMLVYYRLPGLVAVITLAAYVYLVLLVFDWMNAVLTLPGIAALVLGVGIAVDANIIMYERIKDELKVGKSVRSAFRSGTKRSLGTILDANLTTLLAGGVMYAFGTSSVKGFATSLIVSILVSFITCVFGTRMILSLLVNSRAFDKKPTWFGVKKKGIMSLADTDKTIYPPTIFDRIDFVKIGNRCLAFSAVITVVGIIVLFVFKLNLGIDFVSGTRIEFTAKESLTTEDVRGTITSVPGVTVEPKDVTVSGDNNTMGVVRTIDTLDKDEIATLKQHVKDKYGAEPNVSTVSPTVGKELARSALYSVLIASIGIILYVTIRFEIFFALAAIVALLHDAFFIITFFSIFQIEVDVTFIAAVLTIIGYSINDTIVTFDRIRENMKLRKQVRTKEELRDIVNDALRQTLTRSVNTVLTVVFTVVALYVFGSEAIANFSLALLVGLIAGAYSSIFVASQLWLMWKAKTLNKPVKKKVKTSDEPQV